MSSDVESSKTLAGVGSILLILSIVPYAGVVLGIIGIILLLIGIKGLASYYQNNEIYQNSLTGVIFYIIAVIAAAVAVIALVIGFASIIGFVVGIIVFILALIIAFVFYLLAAMPLKKNFRYTCTKIRRTLVCNRWHLTLVGRHTNNNFCWLNTDIHRLDICHYRLLLHETPTTATIRFTTIWLYSTSYTTSSSANASISCTANASNTILPELRCTCSAKHRFLSSLRKTITTIKLIFFFLFLNFKSLLLLGAYKSF